MPWRLQFGDEGVALAEEQGREPVSVARRAQTRVVLACVAASLADRPAQVEGVIQGEEGGGRA
jgi:hypothetical protein